MAMQSPTAISATAQPSERSGSLSEGVALTALTSLFFMWGFITCLNDILIPHLKGVFSLTYTQAMLIQFCFFGAYFLVSIPAGELVKRIGYQRGIVVGLVVASLGCLMFYPAAAYQTYGFFLAALFVLASGITVLQVSANPYVAALGKPETASSRLTLTQAFNSLGTTIAPFFGAFLILSAGAVAIDEVANKVQDADSVKVPYLILAAALASLALFFSRIKLPVLALENDALASSAPPMNMWAQRHLVFGVVAMFLYVGAEVAIGSFLVSFLGEAHIAGLQEEQAAHLIAYYWGGAMVGRFLGAALMRIIRPGRLLALCACGASTLLLVAVLGQGKLAMWAILSVGLCNSIMFPTIFSLAIQGLGVQTSRGSGLLCLAIVGGAIVPLLQGVLADQLSVQLAFLLPAVCYIYIAFFGEWGSKPTTAASH